MQLAETLERLRGEFAECRILAFADISTGIVLYWSAGEDIRQEKIDSLCATASDIFNGDIVNQVHKAVAETCREGIHQAIIIEPQEIGFWLKATNNSNDVLCCVCSPQVDLFAFVRRTQDVFAALSTEPQTPAIS